MIKTGQIYQQENNEVYVITQVWSNTLAHACFSVVYRDGYASSYDMAEDNKDFILYKKLAEYPTWQEAVNSKEFNENNC